MDNFIQWNFFVNFRIEKKKLKKVQKEVEKMAALMKDVEDDDETAEKEEKPDEGKIKFGIPMESSWSLSSETC